MKAIGITCGIGSMLIGARQAGFDVVGNLEWRRYYHHRDAEGRNTFEMNFPGAIFAKRIEDLTPEQVEAMTGADIAFGHPECGAYSIMNTKAGSDADPADLPLFTKLVSNLKPRFFVMDNMPRSLKGYSVEEWQGALPEYDLFFEFISNYNYGNLQKHRNRFFVIGALKSERFSFRPGEFENITTVFDEWETIDENDPCHERVNPDLPSPHRDLDGRKMTNGEFAEWIKNPQAVMKDIARRGMEYGSEIAMRDLNRCLEHPDARWCPPYVDKEGKIRYRIGWCSVPPSGRVAYLLTGQPIVYNPKNGLPLTCRERAKIQGCPDDFRFYLKNMNSTEMAKQTGKFMPVQFCRFVAEQIAAHIKGEPFEATDKRFLKPDPHVSAAKRWYCENVGYSDQERACRYCHINDRCDGPQLRLKENPDENI